MIVCVCVEDDRLIGGVFLIGNGIPRWFSVQDHPSSVLEYILRSQYEVLPYRVLPEYSE